MEDVTSYYVSPYQTPNTHLHFRHHPPPPPSYHYSEPPHQPAPLNYPHHHHHHLPPPSTPYFASSHARSSPRGSHDEVRTLFVAGLPKDVKPREIYHLFREFPGFLSSQLRSLSQPFAFAVFSDKQSAVTAMQALNGMVFDLEKGSTLYIDLAKENSRSKRQRTDGEGPGSDKKHKGSPSFPRGSVESGLGSFHIPGMINSPNSIVGCPPAQRSISEANISPLNNHSTGKVRDNPPCPTIFVSMLGPNCSEQELLQVFSSCRGFLKLKIQRRQGYSVAFVDFQDTACSTDALSLLQGTILHSSVAGEGMRLEYAKSRMGMKRKRK